MNPRKIVFLSFAILAAAAGGPAFAAGKPEIDPAAITRPPGYTPHAGDARELAVLGDRLWNDVKLSTNGMSCNTCHANHGAFQAGFARPYPHRVAMARDKAGVKRVHLDEMIQACMVMPMAAKPLPWDSKDLAALTAHALKLQKSFRPAALAPANPCSARPANPCAARPANPCAGK